MKFAIPTHSENPGIFQRVLGMPMAKTRRFAVALLPKVDSGKVPSDEDHGRAGPKPVLFYSVNLRRGVHAAGQLPGGRCQRLDVSPFLFQPQFAAGSGGSLSGS